LYFKKQNEPQNFVTTGLRVLILQVLNVGSATLTLTQRLAVNTVLVNLWCQHYNYYNCS